MASEKCPKCGAAHKKMSMSPGYGYYECGSYVAPVDKSDFIESHPCTRRQLAAANERADRAEDDCIEMAVAWGFFCHGDEDDRRQADDRMCQIGRKWAHAKSARANEEG